MKQRRRIYYSSAQRIWDHWQAGESMSSIGRRFDRESKGDKIGVRLDPRPSLRFLNERRANATGDTAALLLEKP